MQVTTLLIHMIVLSDFTCSKLPGVDLTGALTTNTCFQGADLTKGTYSVEQAAQEGWLQGAVIGAVNWTGKQLRGAILAGCNLDGASLKGADLTQADLSKASLVGADVDGADLSKANLSGAKLDVELWASKGWLKGTVLHGSNWADKKLSQVMCSCSWLESQDS